jgi:hypothetical protein
MANPTTNYGFVLPTSSDLVTDLPADFDVALQGVDTRLKALQPGTTLGDLAYSSATANTNTRLGVGSTGQVLTVAGGVPTWATPAAGGMTLISTTALTGSSVTLSSIPGTYKELKIFMRGYYASGAGTSVIMRFNGVSTANSYIYTYYGTQDNLGTLTGNLGGKSSSFNLQLLNDTVTTYNFSELTIPDYAATNHYKIVSGTNYGYWRAADGNFMQWQGIQTTESGAITSLYFAPSSGTFAGGEILLYGVS